MCSSDLQSIMDAYGSGVTVPAWTSGDYDSLYIVRVNGSSAHFERDAEGLNNMPTTCP